jgi:hypothetical protein
MEVWAREAAGGGIERAEFRNLLGGGKSHACKKGLDGKTLVDIHLSAAMVYWFYDS